MKIKKKKITRFYSTCVDWLFTFWSQHSIKELQGTCINRVMFTLEFILINTCIFSQNKSENIWAKMDIITEYLLSRNLFTWTVGFPVANYVCATDLSHKFFIEKEYSEPFAKVRNTGMTKVIMQGKLFHHAYFVLQCLSLGADVNSRRMSKPYMGSIFHITNQWNILVIGKYYVNYQNYQNLMILTFSDTKRTQLHIFLLTNSA